MKHRVGEFVTIEYNHDSGLWIGVADYDGGDRFQFSSVELAQVVLDLSDIGAIEPESFEWSHRSDIEQVLVVVPEGR